MSFSFPFSHLKDPGARDRTAEQHHLYQADSSGGHVEGQRHQGGQVQGRWSSFPHTPPLLSTSLSALQQSRLSLSVCLQNTTDAIGRAAAEAMQGPIQAAYKDTFQSIVLPVFERGCQSMFQQINDSFKQGTQECRSR